MNQMADKRSAAGNDLLAPLASQFQQEGYAVVKGVLTPQETELCTNYALLQTADPDYYEIENLTDSQGRYADTISECLLLKFKPLMEYLAGVELHPCYSFLRIYRPGSDLAKHVDRPSCEISTSLALGFRSQELWPLWVTVGGQDRAIRLAAGDMLVYRGADLVHWREVFSGEFWVQVFLHYVDAGGPYADYKFDGRERIGPFDKTRQRRRFDTPQAD